MFPRPFPCQGYIPQPLMPEQAGRGGCISSGTRRAGQMGSRVSNTRCVHGIPPVRANAGRLKAQATLTAASSQPAASSALICAHPSPPCRPPLTATYLPPGPLKLHRLPFSASRGGRVSVPLLRPGGGGVSLRTPTIIRVLIAFVLLGAEDDLACAEMPV